MLEATYLLSNTWLYCVFFFQRKGDIKCCLTRTHVSMVANLQDKLKKQKNKTSRTNTHSFISTIQKEFLPSEQTSGSSFQHPKLPMFHHMMRTLTCYL